MGILTTGGVVQPGERGPYFTDGAPAAGTDEVQSIYISGSGLGGTFTLTFDGHTTGAITWSATNNTLIANIDAALEALGAIGSGGVLTAAGGTLASGIGTVTVTFDGANVCKANVPLMTATSSLTGTNAAVTVATTTAGVAASHKGAPIGALLVDNTNGKAYINTGTAASPTWTVVGAQS